MKSEQISTKIRTNEVTFVFLPTLGNMTINFNSEL